MGKRKRYKGLRFNYKIGDKVLMDKYETIQEFLDEAPTKINSLAPTMETEIFNITWNAKPIVCDVHTVHELYDFLKNNITFLCEEKILVTEHKRGRNYIRKEIYDIDFVREKIADVLFLERKKGIEYDVDFDGDLIHGNSQRYQTFFTKGIKCSCCGMEAKFFAKEKTQKCSRYHLNLYGINKSGEEVLFTKDHIIPKSKGGKDTLDNYQTMCVTCNIKKGNKDVLPNRG